MEKTIEISIILPVFNEGENIAKQIEDLEKRIKPSHEILIVYDFDEDNTVPVVRSLTNKYKNVLLIKNIYGRGLINAVKTGFIKSKGQAVVVMPADLADDPNTILKMHKKIQEGFDIVGATRYSKGGKKVGGEYIKTLLSRTAGILTPLFLGIPVTDISNGFKMYKAPLLKKIKIESNGGWEFSMEIVIKAHRLDYRITEVPTVWKNRVGGVSKFKLLKWLPKYLKWYALGFLWRLNINW